MAPTGNHKGHELSERQGSWTRRMRDALTRTSSPSRLKNSAISTPSNLQLSPAFPRVEYIRDPSPLRNKSNFLNDHDAQSNSLSPSDDQGSRYVRVVRLANGTQILIPDQADNQNHSQPRYYTSITSSTDSAAAGSSVYAKHASPRFITVSEEVSDESDGELASTDSSALLKVDLNERFRDLPKKKRPGWYRNEDGCPHMHGIDDPSYLCATCRRIDFAAILNQEPVDALPPLIDLISLGPLTSIFLKHHCGFCRLIGQMWTATVLRDAPYNISHEEKVELITPKLSEQGEDMYYLYPVRFKQEYGVPAVHLCKNIWDSTRNSMALTGSAVLLPSRELAIRPMSIQRPGSTDPPIPRFGRFINPDQIDIEWIRERLALCDERSVRPKMRYDGVLRAIDVHKLCVVELQDDDRYVTLSYVWGGVNQLRLLRENQDTLYTPGAIAQRLSQIPKTVRDAIKLTRLIGERYLWVDALCIIQNRGDPDQLEQIMKMGDIYQQSTLTIIACCGKDASYGLPGLEPETRMVRQVAGIVGHQAMCNMLPWDNIMLASLWSTRAWTLQEKMLSRRKLIITDRVVIWWCWHSSNPEDEHCAHPYWPLGAADQDMIYFNTENDRVPSKRGALSSFDMYAWILFDYSKRNLTDQRDAARAFQGAFNALADRFDGQFVQGLPDTELEDALLWCPIGSSVRRIDEDTGETLFPSWSWLGWKGKVAYPGHTERDFPTSSVNSPLQWYSATSSDSFTGEQYRAWDSNEKALNYTALRNQWKRHPKDDWCWEKHINGEVVSGLPFQHPVVGAHFGRPFRFLPTYSHEDDPMSRQLNFKTLSARFTLATTPFKRKANFDYEHKIYHQHVLSSAGYSAGYIYTPDPTTMDSDQKSQFKGIQEFIIISRASVNPDPKVGTDLLDRDIFQSSLSLTLPAAARAGFAGSSGPPRHNVDSLDEKAFFDNRIFYKTNPWCLFNVLMIRRDEENMAHRVAVGRIHVGAFMTQNPTWKEITMV